MTRPLTGSPVRRRMRKGTGSASVSYPKTGRTPIVEVTDRCQVGTLCHVRRPTQSFVHSEISCLLSLSPRHSTSRSSSLCSTLYRRTYATSKGYEPTPGGCYAINPWLPRASFEGRVLRVLLFTQPRGGKSMTPGPRRGNFDDSITREGNGAKVASRVDVYKGKGQRRET